MYGFILSVALIGLVITAFNDWEWPGWGAALGAAVATGATTALVAVVLPDGLWFLAVVAGAGVGALAIHWLCDMALVQSLKAAGTYLALRIVFGFALAALVSA